MLHPEPHNLPTKRPIIEMIGVTAGYGGQPALTDINLRVNAGDFIGLLGPSGSGKTTLLKIILGAADVYSGTVIVDNIPISTKKPRVGYVPQLKTIDWNFPATVEEVVLMGRTMDSPLFPWYKPRDHHIARDVMDQLGILSLSKRHIKDLSGGQQQRAFLARALVSSPSLLLLDEPTSGVDIKNRDDIMHLLDQLNHQGVTILMTTHEINPVAAHLPWVVLLNGQKVSEGPPRDIFTPKNLRLTYNADMPVVHFRGMTLVAETPHVFGKTDHSDDLREISND